MSKEFLTANAAVAVDVGRVEWRAARAPAPEAGDVVVAVSHSWISNGTEGSFIRGERIAGDTPLRPGDAPPFPHVPGYQKCGVVRSVGRDVRDFRPGDRVFAAISRVCDMALDYAGHISPAVTAQELVWRLPDGVSEVAASGLVLLQVGYNCGTRAPVVPGDCVAVIGDGMVGHWTAQTLAWRGARVALIGRHQERLALYRLKEGDLLVDATQGSVVDRIREWSGGDVQVVVDTVGSIPAFEELYPVMRHGGHLVSAGFYGERGLLDIQKLRTGELTLHTPAGWNRQRMTTTLELLADGVLETEHLITHRFPAWRAAEAYELILARREGVLGVVLDWDGQ